MTQLPPGARCAQHPERAAVLVCARCGGFACPGCVVSGELCAPCKRRLLKDGVPWTAAEKHRAEARRLGRLAELVLRGELALCVLAAVLNLIGGAGFASAQLAMGGRIAWAGGCLAGLATAIVAGMGWRHSERGRPGPAVGGVTSGLSLWMPIAIGLAPAALTLWTFL